MGGVRVGAHAGVGEGQAVLDMDDGGHLLQIDLVHDAVARGDHVHVGEGLLGPLDEVEAVLVAAVLDGAVPGKGVGIGAAALHGQRMVDDELDRHDGVDLGGVAALLGDGVAQAGQVHEGGLAQDVVADHAHGEPGEVDVAAALDELAQVVVQMGGIGTAHEVLGVDARGIGQAGPGAGLQGIDGGARVDVVQIGAGQGFLVLGVHGADAMRAGMLPAHRFRGKSFSGAAAACQARASRGTNCWSSGPV
ncbi:Uncharacterised protein [Delftia tsuruhatensis]|nr:Uncharacterised protein [Delftia tsuruhatensis]